MTMNIAQAVSHTFLVVINVFILRGLVGIQITMVNVKSIKETPPDGGYYG